MLNYSFEHIFKSISCRINQKKKLAMSCYTRALNEAPQANTHRVQKCLQKLLRSLHKDRHHTIQHFRHLLEMSFEQVHSSYSFNKNDFSQSFLSALKKYDF